MRVTPHVAQNDSHRLSAVNALTMRHEGYAISQQKRKRVEEVFGWMKTVALQPKTRFVGPDRTGWMFTLALVHTTWGGCEIFRHWSGPQF
jgi:hypothetical protein